MGILSFMEIMGTSQVPFIAAFFIGLMMAISPCPLATNITAIAYISKRFHNKKTTLIIGLAYTIGRMLAYILLASLIVWFGLNIQAVSLGLQKYGDKILGPILILMGIVMLGLVKIPSFGSNPKIEALKQKLSQQGVFGGFVLGIIFAMAFCPFSAVLFFGMLIPIAIKAGDGVIIPSLFAFATGLPVIIFSLILVHSVSSLGRIMKKMQVFEKWTRIAVVSVFLLIGVYYTLKMILGWL